MQSVPGISIESLKRQERVQYTIFLARVMVNMAIIATTAAVMFLGLPNLA